jgi:hypothetical protein
MMHVSAHSTAWIEANGACSSCPRTSKTRMHACMKHGSPVVHCTVVAPAVEGSLRCCTCMGLVHPSPWVGPASASPSYGPCEDLRLSLKPNPCRAAYSPFSAESRRLQRRPSAGAPRPCPRMYSCCSVFIACAVCPCASRAPASAPYCISTSVPSGSSAAAMPASVLRAHQPARQHTPLPPMRNHGLNALATHIGSML